MSNSYIEVLTLHIDDRFESWSDGAFWDDIGKLITCKSTVKLRVVKCMADSILWVNVGIWQEVGAKVEIEPLNPATKALIRMLGLDGLVVEK